jgi:predicted metal-dependent hydrolase
MTRAEEARMVEELVARVLAKEAGSTPTDDELTERAQRLSAAYLGGRAVPATVRWVDTMNSRWGSCTPLDRSIRLSRRLGAMPEYVVDYVLLHELAHLLVPAHGPAFWGELAGFERLERARGYLEGWDASIRAR